MQMPNSGLQTLRYITFTAEYSQNSVKKIKGRGHIPNARKVVARVPGVPGISPSLKNATKCGNNDKVTTVVSRNV